MPDSVDAHRVLISPVFGDIVAKACAGIEAEVERRLRLGLPVYVHEGDGITDLSTPGPGASLMGEV